MKTIWGLFGAKTLSGNGLVVVGREHHRPTWARLRMLTGPTTLCAGIPARS